jgi:hypothetical protein
MVKTLDEIIKTTFTSEAKAIIRNIIEAGGDLMSIHAPKCDYFNVIETLGALGINYMDFLRTKEATFENMESVSMWALNFYISESVDSLVTNCGCKRTCLEEQVDNIIETASQFVKKLRKRGVTFSEVKEAREKWIDDKRTLAQVLVSKCGCVSSLEEREVRRRRRTK